MVDIYNNARLILPETLSNLDLLHHYGKSITVAYKKCRYKTIGYDIPVRSFQKLIGTEKNIKSFLKIFVEYSQEEWDAFHLLNTLEEK